MGNYYDTWLEIENATELDIIYTEAYNIDNYDWHEDYKPVNKLKGLTIARGTKQKIKLVAYKRAKGWPFTLKLTFENNRIVRIRIRQVEVYYHSGGYKLVLQFLTQQVFVD